MSAWAAGAWAPGAWAGTAWAEGANRPAEGHRPAKRKERDDEDINEILEIFMQVIQQEKQ